MSEPCSAEKNFTSSVGTLLSGAGMGGFFSRLVAFSLPLTYFLVSVSFYLRTYDSAQIKITLTQAGCGMVILFWVLQLIFQKRWPFTKKDLPLVAPFLAVLVSGIVSYLQSSFQAGSLEEFSRRVFYSFMALIVIAEFRGIDRQRRLLRWLIAGFAVTVFYGFVQYFDSRLFPPTLTKVGLDPFIWRQAFGYRVFSTFGNPNFYGNFLVIITPILIALYYRNRGPLFRPFLLVGLLVPVVILTDKLFANHFGGITALNELWVTIGLIASLAAALVAVWWKSPSAAASGMMIFFGATFINLFASETKGAWVGFVGAIIAMALLAGLFLVGKKARKVTIGLMAMSLVVGILGFAVVRRYAIQRKQSVDFRVFTWISTWDMIRTQPWLGTGIGSFKWAYPAFRRPEIILLEGRSNTETDHAEDEYLEVMYDEGMVGFGIFLWLIITVSVLGFRFLNRLTTEGARPPPGPAFDDRVYKVIAYMGAWWAALLHWTMDVSIRFVSSGIFSFFLPALVVGFVRNDPMPEQQDPPRSSDFWARVAVFGVWAGFFLIPDEHLRPLIGYSGIFYAIGCLLVLAEFLEVRLRPGISSFNPTALLWGAGLCASAELMAIPALKVEGGTPMHVVRILTALIFISVWALLRRQKSLPDVNRAEAASPPSAVQWVLAGIAVGVWMAGAHVWRGYFLADVSHNVAIFFSKQMVWIKSPEFDNKVNGPEFPPDMKGEYLRVGGALEHYEKTSRLNPGFPMARYFVGNVYNDWGSSLADQARQAHQKGDSAEAAKLRQLAIEKWGQSLDAYDRTKKFAPNYVQTHHQVGLLYLKRGELETALGDKEKASENWALALKHFDLYNKLDPVFPPNYYRQSYVYFNQGDLERAEKAYLGALVYNSSNVVNRVYYDRNVESYSNLGRLFYVQLMNQYPNAPLLPIDSALFQKAEMYYLKAIEEGRNSGRESEVSVEPAKSLAVLYNRVGQNDKASALWLKLRQWAPQDSDVQRVFSATPPAR
ncbi:MAG: O-antigen ligase family protein [Elusimicrobia bacterium]|nr:O-antigen ligase family protein [Elusimicrobiota bacterium]